MEKRKRLSLYCWFIVLCFWFLSFSLELHTHAYAATYYVDPSGSDSNPGTESQPWKTIQHAMDTVGAGDTVILEDGTYSPSEKLYMVTNGTSSDRITFQARNQYGAVIQCPTNDQGNYYQCLKINAEYVDFDGINISGGYHYCVEFTEPQGAGDGAAYNVLKNSKIHDSGRECLKFNTNTNDITIENCEIYNAGVRDNTNAEGIDGTGTADLIVRDCIIHNTATYCIYVKREANNALIERNLVYTCGTGPNGGGGIGLGQDGDTAAINCTARNNIIYDCSQSGIDMVGTGHIVYHNIIYDTSSSSGYGIVIARGYNADENGRIHCASAIIKNNIIYMTANKHAIYMRYNATGSGEQDTSVMDSDNNQFYELGGAVSFAAGAGSYTLSEWQTNESLELKSNEADPKFVDKDNGNFRLRSNSPAIDAGADLTGIVVTDKEGLARPSYSGYDIGAYEYIVEAPKNLRIIQ